MRKKSAFVIIALLFSYSLLVFTSGCKSTSTAERFTDSRDGNVYKSVKIGNQIWMAENLRYIPEVVGPEMGSNSNPMYYVYDFIGADLQDAQETDSYKTYGVLYNWPAATNACPTGWHLPSDSEWTRLTDFLGGEGVAGGKLKEAGTLHWDNPNKDAADVAGFTALPGGSRYLYGAFDNVGGYGYWWSATEDNSNQAKYRFILCGHSGIFSDSSPKVNGFSVRCVKD